MLQSPSSEESERRSKVQIGDSFTVPNSQCENYTEAVKAGIFTVIHGQTTSTYTRVRWATIPEAIRLFFA